MCSHRRHPFIHPSSPDPGKGPSRLPVRSVAKHRPDQVLARQAHSAMQAMFAVHDVELRAWSCQVLKGLLDFRQRGAACRSDLCVRGLPSAVWSG